MKQYFARICWNTKGWSFPSGDAVRLEKGTFVAEAGFGHEEWLFNFAWIFHGYHYAFLQPVSRSFEKWTGKTLNALLWTIGEKKIRFQVGEIRNCQILTDIQAQEALNHYRKVGWLESMKDQVAKIGGDINKLDGIGRHTFNVRFRTEDAKPYDSLVATTPTDKIARFTRYTLVEADQSTVDKLWGHRKGSAGEPTGGIITRSGQPGITYDPNHPKLQSELMKLLKSRFGRKNVFREADFVDITVNDNRRKILVEIKTDPLAKRAIRQALGQILEYAYFPGGIRSPMQKENLKLFIVGPGPKTIEVDNYMDYLRNEFRIPITYCSFSLGMELPTAFNS